MGASPLYEFFGGLAECVSGLLLLWRRTALLGALAAVGVLLNVVALNAGYDVPVKLLSSHLCLMAVFLAAPYARRLLGILLFEAPVAPAPPRPLFAPSGWRRGALWLVQGLFIAWVTFGQGYTMVRELRPQRALDPHKPLHGTYVVQSFTLGGVADRALEDKLRWVRIGIDGRGYTAIRFADGHLDQVSSAVDADKKTLTLTGDDEAPPLYALTYEPAEAGVIVLHGTAGKQEATVRLQRDETVPPLVAHGFRWINEFPDYQ
jgi:hypothetical protein